MEVLNVHGIWTLASSKRKKLQGLQFQQIVIDSSLCMQIKKRSTINFENELSYERIQALLTLHLNQQGMNFAVLATDGHKWFACSVPITDEHAWQTFSPVG